MRKHILMAMMAALAVLMVVQSASAQGKLEGVWRITEVQIGGQTAFKITVAPTHPNLIMFTKKYISLLNMGTPTRPDLPANATDAQKVATWAPLLAFAGSYEVKGNTFTTRTIVAKDPSDMVPGNFITSEFKIEGDTLIWTTKTDQNGPIANPIVTKLVRLE